MDGRTTTVTLPSLYTVTATSGDNVELVYNNTAAGDGNNIMAFAGSLVTVRATAASTAVASSNVTLAEVTAPAAGVNGEYTFVMPNNNITPVFTTTTLCNITLNVSAINGMTVSVSSLAVESGEDVTVTISGTAANAGTVKVGDSADDDKYGTMSVSATGVYNKTFTVSNITTDISIDVSFA